MYKLMDTNKWNAIMDAIECTKLICDCCHEKNIYMYSLIQIICHKHSSLFPDIHTHPVYILLILVYITVELVICK